MQSLYFLLPLLVIYELGASTYLWERGQQHVAHRLMADFLNWFGAKGRHLPALVVVAVLIGWHIARKREGSHADTWHPEPKLYLAMAVEAVVLSLPLFVFMAAIFREPGVASASALQPTPADTVGNWLSSLPGGEAWYGALVIAIGAGVYEELLFRLVAIAAVSALCKEVLALPEEVGTASAVVLSSLGFAAIHFVSGQGFEMGRFLFYFVTGLYFAAVYLGRGFGLVVATHTLYDVLVFSKAMMQAG